MRCGSGCNCLGTNAAKLKSAGKSFMVRQSAHEGRIRSMKAPLALPAVVAAVVAAAAVTVVTVAAIVAVAVVTVAAVAVASAVVAAAAVTAAAVAAVAAVLCRERDHK